MSTLPQKRILALDGGGIRGLITVEVLHRLETLLREQTGRPDLRLCEWFDLIAGTSVGAITASLLATGLEVEEIHRFYDSEARRLFQPAGLRERMYYRYDVEYFTHRLREVLGVDTTLGSDHLRTLVLLVLRNVTTDSPWFITNNPRARFNDRSRADCNLDIPLWQLVRASTAAPTFFAPETVTVGGETFVFSDGGLTGYNNPAFEAFLITTAEPYGLSWPSGVDRLLVLSIGTGTPSLANAALKPSAMHLLYSAQTLPAALISATDQMQDVLCRVFGDCLVGEVIDEEVGDLIGSKGPAHPKLFTYLRYDVALTPEGLRTIDCGELDPTQLSRLDSIDGMDGLRQVGRALAEHRLHPEHLARFLESKPVDV